MDDIMLFSVRRVLYSSRKYLFCSRVHALNSVVFICAGFDVVQVIVLKNAQAVNNRKEK